MPRSEAIHNLLGSDTEVRQIGEVCKVPLTFSESWLIDDFPAEDATMIGQIRERAPQLGIISYNESKEFIPKLFSDLDLYVDLVHAASKYTDPTQIRTVPLQMGAYAIHYLHVFEWEDAQAAYVSYIPRGDAASPFGTQALSDIKLLPILSGIMARQSEQVREHTDVIPVIANSVVRTGKTEIPFYITPFDETRSELGVTPRVRGEVRFPVPEIVVPNTPQALEAYELQHILALNVKPDKNNPVWHIVQSQMQRIAQSHAILAQVCGFVPRHLRIDAGDWIGNIRYVETDDEGKGYPLIDRMRLVTVKGRLSEVKNLSEWVTIMRTYTYNDGDRDIPLFDHVPYADMARAWFAAEDILKN